jgi:hypothetical protein
MRPTHATTVLAFILGAAIAGGGTATAAKLITGKDIKNGSITIKDLSPQLRAKLATSPQAGAKGDPGERGDTGPKGDPGLSLITFADSFVYQGRALTNTDAVMTSTAGQLPDASGGGSGGPITLPGSSRYALRIGVSITTQGSGVYECALQVGANGGTFYDTKRLPATTAMDLSFEKQEASFTNKNPITLQYRIVCNGAATRKVEDASLVLIGGAP